MTTHLQENENKKNGEISEGVILLQWNFANRFFQGFEKNWEFPRMFRKNDIKYSMMLVMLCTSQIQPRSAPPRATPGEFDF